MPKPRKNDKIHCAHFVWTLLLRGGVWAADGRSNKPNAGRFSLGTRNKAEALQLLRELDQQLNVELAPYGYAWLKISS